MKLIIDVPNAITLSDVLHEIRREIQARRTTTADNDYDRGRNYGLYLASEILDDKIEEFSE